MRKKNVVSMNVSFPLELLMRIVRYAEKNQLGKTEAVRHLMEAGLKALDK